MSTDRNLGKEGIARVYGPDATLADFLAHFLAHATAARTGVTGK